jgi:HSP20 family protein
MARHSLIPLGFGGSDPILSLHREMNRLFDDAFRGGARDLPQGQASRQPSFFNANMNVSETDNEVRVTVELPGVTEQDIDVSLNDDVLTIRGEKKMEDERGGAKENFHYVERSYGSFQRSLRLPHQANPDEVRAAFQNGVLTVTVPKSAQQERSRRIQIQTGAPQAGQQTLSQPDGGEQDSPVGGGSDLNQQPATH